MENIKCSFYKVIYFFILSIMLISNTVINIEGLANIALKSISIEKSIRLDKGDSYNLEVIKLPEDAIYDDLDWKSSNDKIATVDETGKVTAIQKGTANITVTALPNKKKSTCKVIVDEPVQSVNLNEDSIILNEKSSKKLSVTIGPKNASNKKVTWISENEDIAKVDSKGKVTGIKEGKTTIKVISDSGKKEDSCEVNVVIPVKSIILSQKSIRIDKSTKVSLKATITPDNATNKEINWISSNPSVLTVDEDGNIFGISKGKAKITAVTENGNKKAVCNIVVDEPVESVTLNKSKLELTEKKSEKLIATIGPKEASNKNLKWISENEDIAKVDSKGKVTGIKSGKTTITVKSESGNRIATCEVTVNEPVKSISLNESYLELNLSGDSTYKLIPIINSGNSEYVNREVQWSSSKKDIVSVDNEGTVYAHKVGKATITVKSKDGDKSYKCNVVVIDKKLPTEILPTEFVRIIADELTYNVSLKENNGIMDEVIINDNSLQDIEFEFNQDVELSFESIIIHWNNGIKTDIHKTLNLIDKVDLFNLTEDYTDSIKDLLGENSVASTKNNKLRFVSDLEDDGYDKIENSDGNVKVRVKDGSVDLLSNIDYIDIELSTKDKDSKEENNILKVRWNNTNAIVEKPYDFSLKNITIDKPIVSKNEEVKITLDVDIIDITNTNIQIGFYRRVSDHMVYFSYSDLMKFNSESGLYEGTWTVPDEEDICYGEWTLTSIDFLDNNGFGIYNRNFHNEDFENIDFNKYKISVVNN